MEGYVSWLEKVKPLFHSGKDDESILFCQLPLIWEEAVVFPHLFLDQSHNFVPSVFKVCKINVDAFLESADFLFFLFPGVPLSASPAFWDHPLKGLRRMIFRSCADRDADFVWVDFVVVGV